MTVIPNVFQSLGSIFSPSKLLGNAFEEKFTRTPVAEVESWRTKNELGRGSPQYSGTNGSHSPNASHTPSNTPISKRHKSSIAPPTKSRVLKLHGIRVKFKSDCGIKYKMASSRFSKIFASRGSKAAIIGMIHVPALPGIVFPAKFVYNVILFMVYVIHRITVQ